MPLYTYQCTNCGIQFERIQKFSDAPITRCPECSKKSVKRIIQPAGIVFKGSGWYKTDSRSSSSASTSSTSSSKSSAKDESKSKGESKSSSESSSSSASSSSSEE